MEYHIFCKLHWQKLNLTNFKIILLQKLLNTARVDIRGKSSQDSLSALGLATYYYLMSNMNWLAKLYDMSCCTCLIIGCVSTVVHPCF